MNEKTHLLFGEMLVTDSVISQDQLNEALAIQEQQKAKGDKEVDRIGVILIGLGFLDKYILEKYINKVIESYTN